MTSPPIAGPKTVAEAIDMIEETYEFMLSYAARGVRREEDDPGSRIRDYLERASDALSVLEGITADGLGPAGKKVTGPAAKFLDVIRDDAFKAGAAIRFVLAGGIGSQIIDNLNASIHVRALLTDVFLLDESLKVSGA